jgi:SAM-dependent methyltransferase
MAAEDNSLEALYRRRLSRRWRDRVIRALQPPAPFVTNPREPLDFPLGKWNLYIGGAGRVVEGYVNLDLFAVPGVDVAADAEQLPFPSGVFARVECDAVLEHVRDPVKVMDEIYRVLTPGGYAHLVTPFCHPFHEYPKDYRRFTLDGLKVLGSRMQVVAEGWRTGPTATMLVMTLEYVKMLLPFRAWRRTESSAGCFFLYDTWTCCCCVHRPPGASAIIVIYGCESRPGTPEGQLK